MPEIIASTTQQQWKTAKLSSSEMEAIDHELTCYPERRAVCIEALKIVQAQRRWVSDEAVDAIAAYLNMTPAEVDGVATFYNLIFRQPVGKKVIFLCNSVTCWIKGCENLRAKIKQQLHIDYGETTEDGEYTLIPIACLGDCDHAPTLMIDREHHRDVNEDLLDEILRMEPSY